MDVLTIDRKNYNINVLLMKVKDLDRTKCSYKFLSNDIDMESEVYIKCDNKGEIEYRGKRKQYRIYEKK